MCEAIQVNSGKFITPHVVPLQRHFVRCHDTRLRWELHVRGNSKWSEVMASYCCSPMFENDGELDDSFDFIDDWPPASDEGHCSCV